MQYNGFSAWQQSRLWLILRLIGGEVRVCLRVLLRTCVRENVAYNSNRKT